MAAAAQVEGPDDPLRRVLLVLGGRLLRILRPDHQLGVALRRQVRQLRAQYVHGDRRLAAPDDVPGEDRPQVEYLRRIRALWRRLRRSLLHL